VSSRSASQPACGKREKAKKETRAAAANHPSHTPAVPNLHHPQPSTNTSGIHQHSPHTAHIPSHPTPIPSARPLSSASAHCVIRNIAPLPSSRRPSSSLCFCVIFPYTTAVALPLTTPVALPTVSSLKPFAGRTHPTSHLGTKLVPVTADNPPMPASHT